jgi:uroporphyrinogen-III synthase
MRLLVTRPSKDAKRQAKQLEELGHTALICPLLDIVYTKLTPLQLDGVQALIATSRNALRGLSQNGSFEAARKLPLYCVGEGTADFAQELGFPRIMTGQGHASDLVPLIIHSTKADAGALIYLTGEHLAFDLETPLKKAGFFIPRVICYEAQEIHPNRAAGLADVIRRGDLHGVILMSPRTAAIFARIIKRFDLGREARSITCYCYSDAIAKTLEEIDGLTIEAVSHPKETELFKLIGPAAFHNEALADLEQTLGKR